MTVSVVVPAPLRDLPVFSISDWDKVGMVKNAIRELELGQLVNASQVVDAMGRDDRLTGCLRTRTSGLLGLPFGFEEKGGKGVTKNQLANLEQKLPSMLSIDALSELHKWGLMLGVGLGENVWGYNDDDGQLDLKLKVHHPKFAWWDWNTRQFMFQTEDGTIPVTPGDGRWVVYTPYGYERGWMQGLIRCLFVPWLVHGYGWRDWARYSEVYGSPIWKVKTPANASPEDREKFFKAVAQIGREAKLKLPRTADGQEFDIELLEAKSTGGDTFDQLMSKAETAIAIAILGQNLTTEVKGGSHAASKTHDHVREDIKAFDALTLSDCVSEQSLTWWVRHNIRPNAKPPRARWDTEPPEDKKAKGDSLKALGEGIQALQKTGMKPDVNKIAEDADIPVTGPAGEPPAPAPNPFAPKGQDTEDDSASDDESDVEVPDDPPPAKGKSKLARTPTGALEGQLFVDELADIARGHGAELVKPDLASLKALIEHAASYEELRQALVEHFGRMDRGRFAALMQKALVMAELMGMDAVLEDL